MSGMFHSLVLSHPSVAYLTLERQAVDVSALVVPSPKVPFLRAAGNGPCFENNGVYVINPSLVDADVRLLFDGPQGTFIVAENTLSPNGFNIFDSPILKEGESLRLVLRSTSLVGAKVDVTSMFADVDGIDQFDHELQSDWTDVLVPELGEVDMQLINAAAATAFMAFAGVPLVVDLRVEENGSFFKIVEGATQPPENYTNMSGAQVFLRKGQKLQARKTAGSGILVVNVVRQRDFF